MKCRIVKEKEEFSPIKIEITLESEDDLRKFLKTFSSIAPLDSGIPHKIYKELECIYDSI